MNLCELNNEQLELLLDYLDLTISGHTKKVKIVDDKIVKIRYSNYDDIIIEPDAVYFQANPGIKSKLFDVESIDKLIKVADMLKQIR